MVRKPMDIKLGDVTVWWVTLLACPRISGTAEKGIIWTLHMSSHFCLSSKTKLLGTVITCSPGDHVHLHWSQTSSHSQAPPPHRICKTITLDAMAWFQLVKQALVDLALKIKIVVLVLSRCLWPSRHKWLTVGLLMWKVHYWQGSSPRLNVNRKAQCNHVAVPRAQQ